MLCPFGVTRHQPTSDDSFYLLKHSNPKFVPEISGLWIVLPQKSENNESDFNQSFVRCDMSGNVIVISDPEFEAEVLNASESLVLVYLWASWCGPCRLVAPAVEWAAENYADRLKVIKMEVDPNPITVAQYKVEGVPALRLFQQGQLVESLEGAITKQKLTVLLDKWLLQ